MTSLFEEVPKVSPPDPEQHAHEMARKEFTLQRFAHSLGITSLNLQEYTQEQVSLQSEYGENND